MTAYDPAAWSDLFVAVAGAAAALEGLLFVAVSLNLKQILEQVGLPMVAAQSLGILLALLLLALCVLAPGQPRELLGAELLALGAVLTVWVVLAAVRVELRRVKQPGHRTAWSVHNLTTAVIATVPLLVAGASVLAGAGGGLYWALAETVVGFAVAVRSAWVLLVEILR